MHCLRCAGGAVGVRWRCIWGAVEVHLGCAGGAFGVPWRCSEVSVYFQCIHPVAFQCNSSVVSVYPIQWLFSVIPV